MVDEIKGGGSPKARPSLPNQTADMNAASPDAASSAPVDAFQDRRESGAVLNATLPAFGGHWAFAVDAEEPKEAGESTRNEAIMRLFPQIDELAEIDRRGIQSRDDVEHAIDLIFEIRDAIREQSAKDFEAMMKRRGAWSVAIAVLAELFSAYRKHDIPFHVVEPTDEGGVAFVARTAREQRGRMMLPATTYGITLSEGESLSTAFHEITHAVPGNDVLVALDGWIAWMGDERLTSRLAFPASPEEGDSFGAIFAKLAGQRFRDEAYSGITEAHLSAVLRVAGAGGQHLARGHLETLEGEGGLVRYLGDGGYLGDNHLLQYTTAELLSLAERVQDEPELLEKEISKTMPPRLARHDRDFDPRMWQKRFGVVMGEFFDFLKQLDADERSSHPLKPFATRVMPFMGLAAAINPRELVREKIDPTHPFAGLAKQILPHLPTRLPINARGEIQDVAPLEVGDRPFVRPGADGDLLTRNPEAAREAYAVLDHFAESTLPVLPHAISQKETEVLGAAALLLPDEDVVPFWGRVLAQEAIERTRAQVSDNADMNSWFGPILLSLVAQGYLDEARAVLPNARADTFAAEQWGRTLFTGLHTLSRHGDARAIDFWIDIIRSETDERWMHRAKADLLQIVRSNGLLEPEGLRILKAHLDDSETMPRTARDGSDLVFDLVEEGLYLPEYYPAKLEELDGEVEDSYDFAHAWEGSFTLSGALESGRKELPGSEQLTLMARSMQALRDRGFAEAAERVEEIGRRMLSDFVHERIGSIRERIEHEYEKRNKPMRRSDSFLTHMEKLDVSETQVLGYGSALAADLAAIVELPEAMDGGWTAALDLLEKIPDGAVKVAAMERWASESHHVSAPTDAQRLRLIGIWRQTLEVISERIIPRRLIQPAPEGVAMDTGLESWINGMSAGRSPLGGARSYGARIAFVQRQFGAMLAFLPARGSNEVQRVRREIVAQLEGETVRSSFLAPRILPPKYDSGRDVEDIVLARQGDAEEVVTTRRVRTKQVYELYHDPNRIPVRIMIEEIEREPTIEGIDRVRERIDAVLDRLAPELAVPYVEYLLRLSVAARASDAERSASLYERAHELGEALREIPEARWSKRYAYSYLEEHQRDYDQEVRARIHQAAWERGALMSLARLAVSGNVQESAHYQEEIGRIVQNESIFDVMESADYTQAARVLDEGGLAGPLVFDLFDQAIQTRAREQFEAAYAVDHDLATIIDASHLDTASRDQLLERLIDMTFVRAFRSSLQGIVASQKRDEYLEQAERLFAPMDALLDLAQQRGYPGMERALWRGLRRVTEGLLDRLPTALHAFALARPARFVLGRHPELVHPASRGAVAEMEHLFDATFSDSEQRVYENLPSAWEMREAFSSYETSDGDEEALLQRIVHHLDPDPANVDPMLIDLLQVAFISHAHLIDADDPFETFSNLEGHSVITPLLEHYGYADSDLKRFVREQPEIFSRLLLQKHTRHSAQLYFGAMRDLLAMRGVPLEVRADAFRVIVRSGFVSTYVQQQFARAQRSKQKLASFLYRVRSIWSDKPTKEDPFRRQPLPDFVIAPQFDAMLAPERPLADEAKKSGMVVDEEFSELLIRDPSPYQVLATIWNEPGEIPIRRFASDPDPRYFYQRIEDGAMMVYGMVESGVIADEGEEEDDFDLFDPERMQRETQLEAWQEQERLTRIDDEELEEVERAVDAENAIQEMTEQERAVRLRVSSEVGHIFRRNSLLVRTGSITMPDAFDRVDPRLRLALGGYMTLVPASTRMLLLGALSQTQERMGEREVLHRFFEMTGLEKLAQFLSVQKDVVPERYRKTLARFQQDLKPSTQQEILDTLRISGIDLETNFASESTLQFEHAGTVGELWQGVHRDGRKVAVKILPWKKRRRNEESLRALKRLAGELHLFRHDHFGGVDFNDLYARYRDSLLAEMDYRGEMENLHTLRPGLMRHGIAFPNVHEDLLRRDAMVMDYEDAIDVEAIPDVADRERLVQTTARWLARSIFEDGVFYEDFHPGNVKWRPGKAGEPGRPLVLDYGRIGRLEAGERDALVDLIAAFGQNDRPAVLRSLVRMSTADQKPSQVNALSDEIDRIFDEAEGGASSKMVQQFFGAAAKHGLPLRPNYLQFLKAVVSWEGMMDRVDGTASTHLQWNILEILVEKASGSSNGGAAPASDSGPVAPSENPPPTDTGPQTAPLVVENDTSMLGADLMPIDPLMAQPGMEMMNLGADVFMDPMMAMPTMAMGSAAMGAVL